MFFLFYSRPLFVCSFASSFSLPLCCPCPPWDHTGSVTFLAPKDAKASDAKMTISFHFPYARAMLWLIQKWEDASFLPLRSPFEPGEYKQCCFRRSDSVTEDSFLGFSLSPRSNPSLSIVLSLSTLHHHYQHQQTHLTQNGLLLPLTENICPHTNQLKRASSLQPFPAVKCICPGIYAVYAARTAAVPTAWAQAYPHYYSNYLRPSIHTFYTQVIMGLGAYNRKDAVCGVVFPIATKWNLPRCLK